MAIDGSKSIENAERAVKTAEEKLEEVRLAGATELDLEDARTNVEAAKLALAETVRTVSYQSVTIYVSYLRAVRNSGFSERSLEIAKSTADISKQRFEEGVKTEAAYLADVTAVLNAEIAFLQSENALESARRSLLRFVDIDVNTRARIADAKLPFVNLIIDKNELRTAIQAAGSGYNRSKSVAESARKRNDALSRLSRSVTQKELEASTLSAQNASDAFSKATAETEDQTWNLLSTLEVLTKTVEAGEQMLSIAENAWEKRAEQYLFGLISALERDEHELSFDKSRDSAIRKVEDHFFHVLKIEKARGNDLVTLLEEKVR